MDGKARSALDSLRALVAVGLIIGAIGGLVMGMAWPGEEVGAFGGVEESGNAVVALIGALVAWIGNVLLFVGLIGYGVMLGRQASPPPTAA